MHTNAFQFKNVDVERTGINSNRNCNFDRRFLYVQSHHCTTMKLRNIIVQMASGEIPELNVKPHANAVGQMTEAVGTLALSLKKTTHLLTQLEKGNLALIISH